MDEMQDTLTTLTPEFPALSPFLSPSATSIATVPLAVLADQEKSMPKSPVNFAILGE